MKLHTGQPGLALYSNSNFALTLDKTAGFNPGRLQMRFLVD